MNVNREIANRALEKAGQEPLVDDDITKNTARWRLIKSFYLATILETLSHTSWTCLKRRVQLQEYEGDNYSGYLYAYRLPIDCSKPDSLQDNAEFITEGNLLYTDVKDAVLLYIYNGYQRARYEVAATQPTAENFSEHIYYTYNQETDVYTMAHDYESGVTYYIFSTDDYPNYDELEFDPMLSSYLETRLASKIVLKITGDEKLYQLLYNEAQLLELKAIGDTSAHNKNKANGNRYWGEQLGLSV